MEGNVNQEVPMPIEPPAQAAKAEAAAPVESKPAEEQPGSADEEQLARQRQMIENLKNAGLISEESQIPSPETKAAETIKPRQSLISRFLNWLMTFFGIRRPKTA